MSVLGLQKISLAEDNDPSTVAFSTSSCLITSCHQEL